MRLAVPYCMFMLVKKSVGTPPLPSPLTGCTCTGRVMFFSPSPLKLYSPSMLRIGVTATSTPKLKL
jgi:hypothetical protein